MVDVFISYNNHDSEIAEQVRDYLENDGIQCWMAPRDIPAGSFYTREIVKAIKNCKVFLLVLSVNSQKSKYVIRELDMAFEQNCKIIPFLIDDTEIDDEFILLIKGTQQINAQKNIKESVKKLSENIVNEIGRRTASQEINSKEPCCPRCGSKFLTRSANIWKRTWESLCRERSFGIYLKDTSIPIVGIYISFMGIIGILILPLIICMLMYLVLALIENPVSTIIVLTLIVIVLLLIVKRILNYATKNKKKKKKYQYYQCNKCKKQFKLINTEEGTNDTYEQK